jgi:hypothetical protein
MPGKLKVGQKIDAHVTSMRVFKVMGDTEMNEGRGPRYTVGWFADEAVARLAAEGKAAMGTTGSVDPVNVDVAVFRNDEGELTYGIISEFIQIEYEDPEDVKRKALAKLTPKERRALGLR